MADDAVSREAVLEICEEKVWNGADDYEPISAAEIAKRVNKLPAVQPERKREFSIEEVAYELGINDWQSARYWMEFLHRFYECGFTAVRRECPACGAAMTEGEQDESKAD